MYEVKLKSDGQTQDYQIAGLVFRKGDDFAPVSDEIGEHLANVDVFEVHKKPAQQNPPLASGLDPVWQRAVAEVKAETDVAKLQAWREAEKRESVVTAIDERLAEIAAAANSGKE